jgi:hypothetical protein
VAFDDSSITDIQHGRAGTNFVVSWTSTAPVGTTFQVYRRRSLAWSGTSRSCVLPWPTVKGTTIVGTVDPSERTTDFSATLPAELDTATVTWFGGTYLSPSIVGFRVYASTAPGGAVDYATPIATVPAYPGGLVLDGFGLGRFGKGGFGLAESAYTWTTDPLANGVWTFAVAPYDAAGNELPSPGEVTLTIAAPPAPVAPDGRGVRLSYTYDPVLFKVTLGWLASPG